MLTELWNSYVAKGRESVEDPDSDMAYIEYSAENDEDVYDDTKWHTWMPGLGSIVTKRKIHQLMELMEPNDIIRYYGNRTVASMVSIFPSEWVTAALRVIDPPMEMILAVDVNNSPAGASLVSGHMTEDGNIATRLIQNVQTGSQRWIFDTIREIHQKRTIETIVGDFGGPSRQIYEELKDLCENELFVPLVDRKPRDLGADTLRFYNDLKDNKTFLDKSDPESLTEALAAAKRKYLGDVWVVSRNPMAVDASPLIATILAHGMTYELALTPKVYHWVS